MMHMVHIDALRGAAASVRGESERTLRQAEVGLLAREMWRLRMPLNQPFRLNLIAKLVDMEFCLWALPCASGDVDRTGRLIACALARQTMRWLDADALSDGSISERHIDDLERRVVEGRDLGEWLDWAVITYAWMKTQVRANWLTTARFEVGNAAISAVLPTPIKRLPGRKKLPVLGRQCAWAAYDNACSAWVVQTVGYRAAHEIADLATFDRSFINQSPDSFNGRIVARLDALYEDLLKRSAAVIDPMVAHALATLGGGTK